MENGSPKNKAVHEALIGKERSPGEIVRARRLQMNLSQENLEYSSGVSVSTIGRIERNEVRPSLENIEKLERALDIPLRDAFEKYWRSGHERIEKKSLQGKKLKAFIKMASSRNLSDNDIAMLMDRFLAEGEQQDDKKHKKD